MRALAEFPVAADAEVTPIARGLIHQTFLVEGGGERFVLQALNPMFSPDVHDNIEAVTVRLAERGVPTPRLCRTIEGALFADLGEGGRFRLMTYVEGESYDRCDSIELARAASALVARFHSALDGLDHTFRPLGFPFHDTPRYFEALDRALAEHRDHRLHAEVSGLAESIRSAAEAWPPLGDVPSRPVHLDLKFNNILFEPARPQAPAALALIDLDTLSSAPLWIELGDAWRSWCNRRREHEPGAELDTNIFEASAEAWLGGLTFELSREERVSLAHSLERISLELCARFAADVLEESYFGWNADLFESVADHNWSRARGQLSLHDQARATRGDRLRFLLG